MNFKVLKLVMSLFSNLFIELASHASNYVSPLDQFVRCGFLLVMLSFACF